MCSVNAKRQSVLSLQKRQIVHGLHKRQCAQSTQTAKCVQSTKTANCARSTQTAVCSVYTNGSVLSLHKRQSVFGPHKRQIMLRLRNRQKACENSDLISLSLLVLLFRLMSTVSVFSSVKCAFRHSRIIKTVNVKSLRWQTRYCKTSSADVCGMIPLKDQTWQRLSVHWKSSIKRCKFVGARFLKPLSGFFFLRILKMKS